MVTGIAGSGGEEQPLIRMGSLQMEGLRAHTGGVEGNAQDSQPPGGHTKPFSQWLFPGPCRLEGRKHNRITATNAVQDPVLPLGPRWFFGFFFKI